MDVLGLIGVIMGICLIIYFSASGLNILIGAPLATIVVLLANRMDLMEWLLGTDHSYLAAIGQFLVNMFALFLLGTIFSQYMQNTKATTRIAQTVLSFVGTKNPFHALLALTVVGLVISYGGINSVIVYFAIIPIAHSVFKELNINWGLICIPVFLGVATITMTMLPGTPSPTNVIPAEALGTSLTAGPLLGFGSAIVSFIYGVAYMKWRLEKSLAAGETFYSYLDQEKKEKRPELGEEASADAAEMKLPPFWLSLLPLIALIGLIFLFGQVKNIIVIALAVAIILCATLLRPYMTSSDQTLLNKGAIDALLPTLSMGSTIAFGTVLVKSSGFTVIVQALNHLLKEPVLRLTVLAMVMGVITGSSSGTVGILMNTMAKSMMSEGLDPVLLHRLSGVAASCFVLLPHAGAYLTFSALTQLPQKTTYKDSFAIVGGCHLVATLVMLILQVFVY